MSTVDVTLIGGPMDGDVRAVPDDDQDVLVFRLPGPIPKTEQVRASAGAKDLRIPIIEYAYRVREDHPDLFDYVGERQVGK